MNIEQRKNNLVKMIEKYTQQAEAYESQGKHALAKRARDAAMRAQSELDRYE